MSEEEEKEFYFKVEGRIKAKAEWEAQDNLYKILDGKCSPFIILNLEEIEEVASNP